MTTRIWITAFSIFPIFFSTLSFGALSDGDPIAFSVGPYLEFVSHDTALVRWTTNRPVPTILKYGEGESLTHRIEDSTPKTSHAVSIPDLKPKVLYSYSVTIERNGVSYSTPLYECDNFFNYNLPPVSAKTNPFPEKELTERYVSVVNDILDGNRDRRGYCVVIGTGQGRLSYELGKRSDYHVIGVETEAESVANARRTLKQAGIYGPRVTIHLVESYDLLPFPDCFANLIIFDEFQSDRLSSELLLELKRVLRPHGGSVWFAHWKGSSFAHTDEEAAEKNGFSWEKFKGTYGTWLRLVRGSLPGAGRWTHQYGGPDNSANSLETLGGATHTDQLAVQWLGRPGPRAMVDRNPRKPSPLSVNGLLFTQGLRRIIAQDAYNGAILWSLEIPHLARFNMPRDCSNWCLDDESLYVAIQDLCWRIDAESGSVREVFDVSKVTVKSKGDYDWGYIARSQSYLYGSAVKAGSSYRNFRGKADAGWYDATTGPVTYKVCSDIVFALDPETGSRIWDYSNGTVINPTITIADGSVFFVECRSPSVKNAGTGRIAMPALWENQFLVALDQNTGEMIWERPIDTADGIVVFYLLHSSGTLLIASSNTKYHLYGYRAADGERKWEVEHGWIKGDHGQHMQHPAVVGEAVYLRPCGYRVDDGTLLTKNMPPYEGGCATFAGTQDALVYRGKEGAISIWDVSKETVSHWYSIRPGCWLSTIAAGGMILSPEGGGGCSCGGWLETSIGFSPR